jgi:hypothetical protein
LTNGEITAKGLIVSAIVGAEIGGASGGIGLSALGVGTVMEAACLMIASRIILFGEVALGAKLYQDNKQKISEAFAGLGRVLRPALGIQAIYAFEMMSEE